MTVDVELEVLQQARSGDARALVRLIETYQGPVYAVAMTLMREPADAADMTQETFVHLLRSLRSYRGDVRSLTGWVHRLAVNVCLDALRRRQRRPQASLDSEPRAAERLSAAQIVSADPLLQPEWEVERHESVREVREALAELPTSQRRALTLHYFEDRPYEEIAATMGLPLNTVKSHILRGKERMARLLGAGTRPMGARSGFVAAAA